jgi:hypothetical protein
LEDTFKAYKEASAQKLEKIRKKAKDTFRYLSGMRMPFLFGFMRLHYHNEKSEYEVREGTQTIRELYRIPTNASASTHFDILDYLRSVTQNVSF